MSNRHLWQLKESKSWGPFQSYQLNSTANPAHLPQRWPNGLNWQCCLAGSFKTAPRILIFSIAMGAKPSFQLKSTPIWAPTFFMRNNSFIAIMQSPQQQQKKILSNVMGKPGNSLYFLAFTLRHDKIPSIESRSSNSTASNSSASTNELLMT